MWHSIRTMRILKPGVWFMENVTAIDSASTSDAHDASDLEVICSTLREELPGFWVACLRHIDPTVTGVPAQRDRVAIVGVRQDLAAPGELATVFGDMIASPSPVLYDWRKFLGFPRPSGVDLTRVGQRPSAAEQVYIAESGCRCHFDPDQVCAKHPCQCKRCTGGDRGACIWRGRHKNYIGKNYTSINTPVDAVMELSKGLLTYCQVAEMQGAQLPTSQRERNMINIYAAHADNHPLSTTLAVMDKEQSMGRNGLRRDGRVGAMCTNSSIFSFADAATLTTAEKAKLMGHDLHSLELGGVTEGQFRRMLGMSVHRGVAGMIMISRLATLGS